MNRRRLAASLVAVGLLAGCGGGGGDDDAKLRAKVDRLEDKLDQLQTSTSTSTITSTSTTTTSTTIAPTTTAAPPTAFPEHGPEEEVTEEEAAAIDGCAGVTTAVPEGDIGDFADFKFPMPGPSKSLGAPTSEPGTSIESLTATVYANGCDSNDVAAYLDSVPASAGWDLESTTDPDPSARHLGGWSFHYTGTGSTVQIDIYDPSGSDQTYAGETTGVGGPWLDVTFYLEDRD